MLVEPGPQDGSGGRGQTIAAPERAMDVLLLFARSRQAQLGITEIGRELGLPKAAIHRIPASLRSRGLIGFDQVTPLHEFVMSVPMGCRSRCMRACSPRRSSPSCPPGRPRHA